MSPIRNALAFIMFQVRLICYYMSNHKIHRDIRHQTRETWVFIGQQRERTQFGLCCEHLL